MTGLQGGYEMGKPKKEANKVYYCVKLDEFSLTQSPITKRACE